MEYEDGNEEWVADKQAAMRCMNNVNHTQNTVITATRKTQKQEQYPFKTKEYIYISHPEVWQYEEVTFHLHPVHWF